MSEWKEYKLSEICSRLSSGKNLKAERIFEHGLYPVYGGNGLRGYTDEPNFKGSCAIIGRQGAYCGNVRYFAGEAYMTEHAVVAQGNELVDNYYLAVLLSTMHLENLSGQSAQPGLAVGTLAIQSVSIPEIRIQQRIASILSSLDAKIENNNKINAKLEEIAQNLFKEWFVDFGPFKNGKFVESELGLIPEGWRVGTLEEVCTKITDGSHFSPQNSDKDNIPMLSVKDMEEYGFKYKTCKHISKEDYLKLKESDCVPQVNDILVAKDGSYLKEIFICDEFKEQAILSSIAIFRPNNEIVTPDYLLSILKSPKVMKDVKENYVSGSAVPRIVLKDFKKLPILIPTYKVQSEFTNIYKSCRDKIYGNCNESQRLSTLRDTLLPKLMSGEIEV